jgi:FtsH-binding integral membrane protein
MIMKTDSNLLGLVLGYVSSAFLVAAAAAYLTIGIASVIMWPAFIIAIILIFVINANRNNIPLSRVLFYVFAGVMGAMIGPALAFVSPYIVFEAATTTGLGMVVLGLVAYTSSINFLRFQGIALGALIALVIVGIIGIFINFIHPTVFAWLTLGVFTLLTLVDFARLKQGGNGSTAIELAMSIFLDGINIFIALLQIFGGSSRRN